MYETQGVVDEAYMREVYKYTIPKARKIVTYSLYVFYGLIAVFSLIAKAYGMFFWVFALLVAFLLLPHFTMLKSIKKELQKMSEISGKAEIEYYTSCESDGIIVKNLATGASVKIEYIHVTKIINLSAAYILFTKSGQHFPVFKNKLTGEQQKEFIYFINTKCNLKK